MLGSSTDPECYLKKRIEDLKYGKLPPDSILFYEDGKGQIGVKTYVIPSDGPLYNPRYPRLKK